MGRDGWTAAVRSGLYAADKWRIANVENCSKTLFAAILATGSEDEGRKSLGLVEGSDG